MRKKLMDWFEWLFLCGNFKIYWGNVFKLILLWICKIVHGLLWVGDVFIGYVKKPNILALLAVLMIGCVFGCLYSYSRIDKMGIYAPERQGGR